MYAFLRYCAIGHKCHLGVLIRKLKPAFIFSLPSDMLLSLSTSKALQLIYWEINVSLQTFLFPSKFPDKNTFPK